MLMRIFRRARFHLHALPGWCVRSVVVLTTILAGVLLETAPWRESGVAAPAVTQGPPVLASVASSPTPTPTLVVVATKRPTPEPLPADDVPTPVPVVVDQEPAGLPPLSTYAAGLQPKFRSILTDLSHLTRYDMSVEIFPERRMLEGKAVIAVRNNSTEAWSSIVFRLPANHPRMNTGMQLDNAVVDGLPVQPVLSPSATVATLPLASPLEAGHWVRIELTWRLHYLQVSNEDVYVRNGAYQDMINLPHFYPELAVHAPGAPGTNAQGWWIQEIPPKTDVRFHDAVLMTVTAQAPSDHVMVGSGTPVHQTLLADGRLRRQWTTGPVRGFVLQASPLYQVASRVVAGVQVRSFHHAEDEPVALRALEQAAQALEFFSEAWMPYPYTHLTLVASPLGVTAMEYSNLIQIGVMRYRVHPVETRFLVTHEVAHQWIYLLIHSDPVHHPGLDEGLAELSYVYMMEAVDPNFNGAQYITYWRNLNAEFARQFDAGSPWWLDRPYHNFRHYYITHYRRPAVVLGEIWSDIGHEAFTDGLRRYMAQYRFRIVAPEHLTEVFRDAVPEARLAELEESIRTSAVPAS